MAGINTMGLTFNLPNFNGTLYGLTPEDTPFLSAIGALSGGGEIAFAKDFEWQAYDLRSPESPSHLEGQNAPAPRARVRTSIDNVTQIFHSAVSVSYTKLAAIAQRNGLNNVQPTAQADEMTWQVTQELKGLKRDIEYSFLNNTYAKPADSLSSRKTRGLLQAITTNVQSNLESPGRAITATASTDNVSLTAHGLVSGQPVKFSALTGGAGLTAGTVYFVVQPAVNTFKVSATLNGSPIDITSDATVGTLQAYMPLTEKIVMDLMQQTWDNGGIQEQGTATIMCNSGIKRQLTKIFIKDKNFQEQSRNVGGVSVETIITDFGRLNIMLNRYMPTSTMSVVSLEVCKPRILLIPDKGFLFVEPLAKVGASEQAQLYGEIGLEYGAELQHGKITEISPVTA